MKLKTATLIAIIGQVLGFLPSLIFKFIEMDPGNYKVQNWIYFIAYVISAGTLVLFLGILYKNQK